MIRTRYIVHLFVVFFFLVTTLSSTITVVESARAAPAVSPTPEPRLLPTVPMATPLLEELVLRDTRSTRTGPVPTPTPLATPMPIDPNATPLAAPTPPPPPTPAPPAPTPPPAPPAPEPLVAAASGWVHPIPLNIGQYFSAGHPALDILSPCGTPVLASLAGTIVQAGWKDNGGGNVVTVDSGNGFVVEYNHLQGVALASGWVPAGTVIGWIGATGWATGCHLHYAVMLNGQYVDPLIYL